MKKNLLSILASAMLMCPVSTAQADEFALRKGGQFPLCRVLHEIINLPINKGIEGNSDVAREITIPKSYTNFGTVTWEPIPPEDIGRYITSEETKTNLKAFKNRMIKIEKIWDGVGDSQFEKTSVNLDHWTKNGNETVLRYRLPNWKVANCMLPDNADEAHRKGFRGPDKNGISNKTERCYLFTYKGRIYHSRSGGISVTIFEPKSHARSSLDGDYRAFYDIDVCVFQRPFHEKPATKE